MAACAACAALPLCIICTWGMHGPVFRSLRSERKHAPCTIRCRMRQLNSVFIQKLDCWQPRRRTRSTICLYSVATKLPPIPATPPTLPTQPSCLPPHSASHPCTAAPPPGSFGWQGSEPQVSGITPQPAAWEGGPGEKRAIQRGQEGQERGQERGHVWNVEFPACYREQRAESREHIGHSMIVHRADRAKSRSCKEHIVQRAESISCREQIVQRAHR